MKIFITGVAGFLGSHLAEKLIALGHDVSGCDSLIGGELINVPRDVKFYQYDCVYRNSMLKITKDIDIVYHCAATAYEGLSVFSPHVVCRNIFDASVSVYSAAIENNVRRIINCSSMARYGANEIPFREDFEPRPQDPYGIAKVAAENILTNLCTTHGVEFVNAVPHNIIGPRQKYDDPYRNVASIMINRILNDKPPIIYGDGEQKRCFSFINDCLFCLVEMMTSTNVVGETINIGPDEEFVSINHLFSRISHLMEYSGDPIYMPGRPQEVRHATCSAEKARQLLGYKTTTSLDDGLQSMIDAIKKIGPRQFHYHLDIEIHRENLPATWSDRLI